jgi:hypothetical protein
MATDIWTAVFWKDAVSRLVSAGANSATTALAIGAGGTLADVPWYAVLSAAGIGALLEFLRALASLKVPNGTASFLPEVVAAPKPNADAPPDSTPVQ